MQPSTAQITALIVATSIFILLLALFVIAILYKYKKRQQRYEEALLSARLEVQEQTMQHIARELHDNMGARLTRTKLTLATLAWHQPQVAMSNVAGCMEDIASIIHDLRALGHSLDGDYIAANGLVSALQQEVRRTGQSGHIQAVLRINGEVPVLTDAVELFIFRIVQEAMQNVLKHAQAAMVEVVLQYSNTGLTITIADNGNGMPAGNTAHKGMGIINMKRRAALIGGQFYLQQPPTGGTIATLSIAHQ